MSGSLPKCFDILNEDYYGELKAALNATGDASELQALINEAYADLSMLMSTLQSQIESLAPIAALMEIPTDLASALKWINGVIDTILGPSFAAYQKLLAQVAAVTQAVADIEAAINLIKSERFPGIEIDIPAITIGCSL